MIPLPFSVDSKLIECQLPRRLMDIKTMLFFCSQRSWQLPEQTI